MKVEPVSNTYTKSYKPPEKRLDIILSCSNCGQVYYDQERYSISGTTCLKCGTEFKKNQKG